MVAALVPVTASVSVLDCLSSPILTLAVVMNAAFLVSVCGRCPTQETLLQTLPSGCFGLEAAVVPADRCPQVTPLSGVFLVLEGKQNYVLRVAIGIGQVCFTDHISTFLLVLR